MFGILDSSNMDNWSMSITSTMSWEHNEDMGLSSYMLQPTKMRGNIYVGFHKRGYPNSWMVYFMENPITHA